MLGATTLAAIAATLTIWPRRRSFMPGSTALMNSIGARWWIIWAAHHWSGSMVPTGPNGPGTPGIVDHDRHRPEPRVRFTHRALDIFPDRDVGRGGEPAPASRRDLCHGLVELLLRARDRGAAPLHAPPIRARSPCQTRARPRSRSPPGRPAHLNSNLSSHPRHGLLRRLRLLVMTRENRRHIQQTAGAPRPASDRLSTPLSLRFAA